MNGKIYNPWNICKCLITNYFIENLRARHNNLEGYSQKGSHAMVNFIS